VSRRSSGSSAAPLLLAVPNVCEGRDARAVAAIAGAFSRTAGVRLLDVHSDGDHNRSVYTLGGAPGGLAQALVDGAREVLARVQVGPFDAARGQHPHVGALDVAPIVYLSERSRGAACAEALVLADRIGGELGVPVFLYGELTTDGADPRTRTQLRRGGTAALARRVEAGELRPDFGPPRLHPTAGATLVAARPALVAFNLQLAPPASLADARRVAALVREGGADGLPGVRAIGVELAGGVAQVSMNIERPQELPLAIVVARVREHAVVASAELVGLASERAFADFPPELPLLDFDPDRRLLERVIDTPGGM
jgi:glutamate formiminotransferase / 5-formyltetrahydrofolate cyclo-ligase